MKSVLFRFAFHWSWFLMAMLPLIDSLNIGSYNVTTWTKDGLDITSM